MLAGTYRCIPLGWTGSVGTYVYVGMWVKKKKKRLNMSGPVEGESRTADVLISPWVAVGERGRRVWCVEQTWYCRLNFAKYRNETRHDDDGHAYLLRWKSLIRLFGPCAGSTTYVLYMQYLRVVLNLYGYLPSGMR